MPDDYWGGWLDDRRTPAERTQQRMSPIFRDGLMSLLPTFKRYASGGLMQEVAERAALDELRPQDEVAGGDALLTRAT